MYVYETVGEHCHSWIILLMVMFIAGVDILQLISFAGVSSNVSDFNNINQSTESTDGDGCI